MELSDFTTALFGFNEKWNDLVGAALRDARGGLSPADEGLLEALGAAGEEGLSGPQLIDRLAIDKAHLARSLEKLRARQWITTTTAGHDVRAKVHQLARRGWTAHKALAERRQEQLARRVADLLPEVRMDISERLFAVGRALEDRNPWKPLQIRQAQAGDYGWVIERHAVTYASEFGYDGTFEAFVAEGVARFVKRHDARREAAWIAERDGRRVGSAFVVRESAKRVRLRFFLLDRAVRGGGFGAQLLDHAIAFARRNEEHSMVLWTQSILTSAIGLYHSRGFVRVREEPFEGFGRRLRAQEWALDLKAPAK